MVKVSRNPVKETDSPKEEVISPEQQLTSFLKTNKEDHFNFEEDNIYRVPFSSLTLNIALGGGITPGAHRACGLTAGGKTSNCLDHMFHFLSSGEGRRGVYVKAEGRLSEEMKRRSGIKFTNKSEEWEDGVCFVLESNVYEAIFSLMGELIRNNPQKKKYFFILDSLDMMARREDLAKPIDEAGKVAGGALLTSVFLKKAAAALEKRGHFCWFISQVRDSIKINSYSGPSTPRQANASGGHAVEHAGDLVLEFLPRYQDDVIRENDDKTSKIIGHYAKCKIIKSNNEKYGVEIKYPVKYGRTGGKSVWIEREVVDLLLGWGLLNRKGAWYSFDATIIKEIEEATGIKVQEQIQGINSVYNYLENEPKIVSYLADKFTKLALSEE